MQGYNRILDLDLILMAILGAFAAAFLIDSRSYNPTAALFPRLISTIVLLLILWTAVHRLWELFGKPQEVSPSVEEVAPKQKGVMTWYVSLITIVIYFLLIYVIGFTWAALVYLVILPILLGYRKYKIVFAIAVMWTVFFVLVFTYVVHTRIPGGLLGDFLQRFASR
jgi:uncharacterized membrane protein (DUF485 family)